MKLPRRTFLKQSALGAGALLLGAEFAEAKTPYFDPYERLTLGETGLKVSRLCLGTGMKGSKRQSNQTRLGKEKFSELIRGAYDRGIRVYDLADLYGSHPYIVPALKGVPRDKYILVSKIWFRPGNAIPEPERPDADVVVHRFLKEIGTDYIDLVLLHCCTAVSWDTDLKKQMEIMDKLKQKGVIRAHGVSCHSMEALETAAVEPWVDSVHLRINPYGMSMDGPVEKVVPIIKKIHGANKGVIGMKIVGEGRLRNDPEKRQESIKFALQSGIVDVLNVGFESLAEIDDFAAMVKKVPRQSVA
jgi:aryl-alcohol dehydrogenase-like predicted oxidoreductase